jgi:outer membrane protein assembly factor BamA
MSRRNYTYLLLWLLLLVGCDATKKVPEQSYLLNKVDIRSDVRGMGESELTPYLRQRPNASIPLFGKWKLHMYNLPDNDSTWLNRQLLKHGNPPVLYNEQLAVISAEQIRLHLNNKGYLNAKVDTMVVKEDKRAHVTYHVTGNEPYRIRTFLETIHSVDTTVHGLLSDGGQLQLVKEGDLFDLSVLDDGRENMTTFLKNRGYYNFLKDHFYFLADTTVGDHQVDVTLSLNSPPDGLAYNQYNIGNVLVVNGVEDAILSDSTRHSQLDTIDYKGIQIVSQRDRFLLPKAIYYNTFIRPERLYSDRLVERTYASLNGMGPISQTAIRLTPVVRNDSNYLDTRITLFPGNMHYMQFGVDGTNSAGDLGIASNVSYEHRNFFKGGETFRFRLNGAYEFIGSSDSLNLLDDSYYEYGAEVFLSIPQLLLPWRLDRLRDQPSASTDFTAGINYQNRPEYLRQFFNLSSRFQWSSFDWKLQNVLEPVGITYVRMPRTSAQFDSLYMDEKVNPILRYSYDEQLIVRSAYHATFTNYSRIARRSMPTVPFRLRAGIEVAGWLPHLATSFGAGQRENGRKTFFKIPYSEYVKGDFDFAPMYVWDDKNTLAARVAVGVAYPYGNAIVLPFEKRYFGGGANSVRGWSTRSLGPGTYSRDSLGSDFGHRIGDVKLDLSLEFRRKMTSLIELAGFIDAGNIWTIKDYEEQPGGLFRWDRFYKELAVAYGVGLRLDLNFLILRLDGGMKAHNPALPEGERWTLFSPKLRRDFALHFAIGYPF